MSVLRDDVLASRNSTHVLTKLEGKLHTFAHF